LKTLASTGLILAIIGAALDFISGYAMVTNSSAMSMNETRLLGGVGLFALGIVVIVTGATMVTPLAAGRMSLFGLLMEVYGVVMGLASSYIPSMNGTVADAMLVVGILMFVNGMLMQSRRMNRHM
jgi:hypothetical protein